MKPFNLEAALKGEKVVTRNGQEVGEIHYFKNVAGQSMLAVINSRLYHFAPDGRYFLDDINSSLDLFMAPKKRTVYVNVHRSDYVPSGVGFGTAYSSVEEANKSRGIFQFIKTIAVEIEEQYD